MRKKLILVPATLMLIGAAGIGGKLAHADSRTQPGHITAQTPAGASAAAEGDTLNQQVGDQKAPDAAPAGAESESTAPDADNVQSENQSGSDDGADSSK